MALLGMPPQSLVLPSQRLILPGSSLSGQFRSLSRVFLISPAVNGKNVWDLDIDGPLNLGTQGNWYATPLSTFSVSAKLWGEGGDGNRSGLFGAGAFSEGVITFIAGTTYRLGVGQGRGAQSAFNGAGGGWSGVLIDAPSTAILIAAGGGANGWSGDIKGGAGGWPNGTAGDNDPNTNFSNGGSGGGQSSGGSGGGASGTFAQSGTSGTSLQGGGGGYAGGGGGGGYFGGGGGGGADVNGAGGGGGSSYFNPALVIAQSMLSGSGTTPGNSSDADRAGAGVSFSGRLILK